MDSNTLVTIGRGSRTAREMFPVSIERAPYLFAEDEFIRLISPFAYRHYYVSPGSRDAYILLMHASTMTRCQRRFLLSACEKKFSLYTSIIVEKSLTFRTRSNIINKRSGTAGQRGRTVIVYF